MHTDAPSIFNSDLSSEQEAPRGSDGFARHWESVCIFVWLPDNAISWSWTWLFIFLWSTLLHCARYPHQMNQMFTEKIHKLVHMPGNSQTDVLCGSYLTQGMTFNPGSVIQAGRAQSVTNPLDCSDKDEGDIWTQRQRRPVDTERTTTTEKMWKWSSLNRIRASSLGKWFK